MEKTLGAKHGIRTWLEIDTKAIRENLNKFRSILPKNTLIAGVVKSNAYGHGLVDFSKELQKIGIDWLAVDSIVEGVRLRERGLRSPILVLGYTLPDKFLAALENNISITISSFENMEALGDLYKENKVLPKIHLKFNTGMNRQGFSAGQMNQLIEVLREFGDLNFIEGIYTHLAAADENKFRKETLGQLGQFKNIAVKIKDLGVKPIIHALNTPGTIGYAEESFDMIRLGIGLYGVYPSVDLKKRKIFDLAPVLSWKTIISEINTAGKGEAVGYGFTEKLKRKTKFAVCPIGYWHGYPRNLSNKGQVLICGKRAKVLGRVSMDMIVVDVTDIPEARVGDEVVLLGRQGDEEVSAEEVALILGTISYEIITRINPLIQKFYL